MISRDLVESCLYNFLGYGNLDGSVWFMGIEEGAGNSLDTEPLLRQRAQFSLAMDLPHAWEECYGIPLRKQEKRGSQEGIERLGTWRFIAAYLLALEGVEPSGRLVEKYILSDKRLGRLDGRHFLGELLPLPKQRRDKIHPYKEPWCTVSEYEEEVLPKRRKLILEELESRSSVQLLIAYGGGVRRALLKGTWRREVDVLPIPKKRTTRKYTLWQVRLRSRETLVLETPFFGNGQMSYEDVWRSTQWLLELIPEMHMVGPSSRS
jgi:hypothetical protein